MKALLKTGSWVDIDTTHLFNDQYNTTDGRRIFDRDITRVVDDPRGNLGKCKWCGALVERGHEEEHYAAMEAKPCDKCFYWRDVQVDSQSDDPIQEKVFDHATGRTTVRHTRTVTLTYERKCTYNDKDRDSCTCCNQEHRKRGIAWFTPENTFFLKYPDGLKSIPFQLMKQGFVYEPGLLNAAYHKKLGSYYLQAQLIYTDGKPTGIECYRLHNCRRDLKFRCVNGTFEVMEYGFGYRSHNWLPDVPYDVCRKVKDICNEEVPA